MGGRVWSDEGRGYRVRKSDRGGIDEKVRERIGNEARIKDRNEGEGTG